MKAVQGEQQHLICAAISGRCGSRKTGPGQVLKSSISGEEIQAVSSRKTSEALACSCGQVGAGIGARRDRLGRAVSGRCFGEVSCGALSDQVSPRLSLSSIKRADDPAQARGLTEAQVGLGGGDDLGDGAIDEGAIEEGAIDEGAVGEGSVR